MSMGRLDMNIIYFPVCFTNAVNNIGGNFSIKKNLSSVVYFLFPFGSLYYINWICIMFTCTFIITANSWRMLRGSSRAVPGLSFCHFWYSSYTLLIINKTRGRGTRGNISTAPGVMELIGVSREIALFLPATISLALKAWRLIYLHRQKDQSLCN